MDLRTGMFDKYIWRYTLWHSLTCLAGPVLLAEHPINPLPAARPTSRKKNPLLVVLPAVLPISPRRSLPPVVRPAVLETSNSALPPVRPAPAGGFLNDRLLPVSHKENSMKQYFSFQ